MANASSNVQRVLFLFVCCLILQFNCYVINTIDDPSWGIYYHEGKTNDTKIPKCLVRSSCEKMLSKTLCDSLDIVCPDSDLDDTSTDITYYYVDNDVDTDNNNTLYPTDHHSHVYSHISPAHWSYFIIINIISVILLRTFCCNNRRRTVLYFIPDDSPTEVRCHGVSNPLSEQQITSAALSRCPMTTQREMPAVDVESNRQKDELPPPPYPAVVSTETLPPPDYNTLFPRAETLSTSPSPS